MSTDGIRRDEADREADAALAELDRRAADDLDAILNTELQEVDDDDAPPSAPPSAALTATAAPDAADDAATAPLEVRPGSAVGPAGTPGDDVEVECPGCGLLVVGSDPRASAEWFCPRCDYPLFFTSQPVVPEVDGERRGARHRLPGVAGRAITAAGPCWHCGEWNEANATACLRCAATLPKPEPPQLGPFETVEVPEPELVEVEVLYWPPIVISVVGGFAAGMAFLWGVLLLMDRL